MRKKFGSQHYLPEEIALAKCMNEPLWPCKIIEVKTIPGLIPYEEVYHIKFINDNNFSYVNECHLVKFTSYSVE